MKISKRVREEAALICAVAASCSCRWYGNIHMDLGTSREAYGLAADALTAAFERNEHGDHLERAYDAEAEAMLRTGWSPP